MTKRARWQARLVRRTTMIRYAGCLLLVITTACKPSASQDVADAHAVSPPISSSASAAPKAPVVSVAPIAPTPPQSTGAGRVGASCKDGSDCSAGLTCVFEEEGCSATGQCRAGGVPTRNCNAAIPMCACRDHRTFYGPGGCAGKAGERWELYACPCKTDADCVSGQRCVPVDARPHRASAAKECRAPHEIH